MLQSQAAKQPTFTWMDLSSTGFTLTDVPLGYATIQYPSHKLNLVLAGAKSRYHTQVEKDTSLLPFGWDIEPAMSTEVIIR